MKVTINSIMHFKENGNSMFSIGFIIVQHLRDYVNLDGTLLFRWNLHSLRSMCGLAGSVQCARCSRSICVRCTWLLAPLSMGD